MNFKRLVTWLMLGGAGITPLATAQNPVILQGNYVSNVFGQSNFILNPNAQTNTANVTVSNATVTRSTTTPLVATSEFLITTSTATGYADWATRTFDQGMKGQNCEARFTYRGFSVGSTTVQIRQGSNTVAQLTLTASTDPRIASINFPCGDLSAATSLRVQQATASLTGTNELSGLYLGLATNQANVAQAEFYGSMENYAANCTWIGVAGFGAIAADNDCGTYYKNGQDLQPSTRIPAIQLNPQKSGNFQISVRIRSRFPSNGEGMCAVYNNSTFAANLQRDYATPGMSTYEHISQTIFNLTLTAGSTNTINIRCATTSDEIYSREIQEGISWSVYRFPTSSELVVTPERQNVFGGVKWTGNVDHSRNAVASKAIINTTAWSTPVAFGKASIASSACGLSTNDAGVCFQNVPPGTYEISNNLEIGAQYNFGTAGATLCQVQIYVGGSGLTEQVVSTAFAEVTAVGASDFTQPGSGVIVVPSFQSTLYVVAKMSKDTNNGRCVIRSATEAGSTYPTRPTITMKPLDQPSNSALYVQGPVKAAATGDAVPSGFQNEAFNVVSSTLTLQSNGAWKTGTGLTLQPGIYFVIAKNSASAVAPTDMDIGITDQVNTAPINDSLNRHTQLPQVDAGNTCCGLTNEVFAFFRVTSAKTFYPTTRVNTPVSSNYTFAYTISAFRLN
jgi:hypothetical protein